jgi:hypothetical protein
MPRGPKRVKGRAVRAAGKRLRASSQIQPSGKVQEELAVELYTRLRLALVEIGVTRTQLRRAVERSWRLSRAPTVSGPIMSTTRGIGWILDQWSRKAGYLDTAGKPRVLAIRGPGATFESLARRALPHMSVEAVVALTLELAEVAERPGGKIALLGSILVKVSKSADRHLAHLVRQLDQLLTTSVHNRRATLKGVPGGRMERNVIGLLAKGEYPSFMQEVRPQVYELLTLFDAYLEKRGPKTAAELKSASAVSLSMYVNEEADLERAGLSALASSLSANRPR